MRSICKLSNLGFAMMVCSPVVALTWGWEALFPVALCSLVGGAILIVSRRLPAHLFVGQLAAELVQDLALADRDRRDLVLDELKKAEATGSWLNFHEQRRNCGGNRSTILATAAQTSAGLGAFDTYDQGMMRHAYAAG
jgi:hypothetical protein